ncbi:hypothetical protein MPH_13895, partial [Macrophomina phaseolina MS6]
AAKPFKPREGDCEVCDLRDQAGARDRKGEEHDQRGHGELRQHGADHTLPPLDADIFPEDVLRRSVHARRYHSRWRVMVQHLRNHMRCTLLRELQEGRTGARRRLDVAALLFNLLRQAYVFGLVELHLFDLLPKQR